MAYLNRTEIIGNTGKPATVVTLPSGGQKVLFSVAVSKTYNYSNPTKEEKTAGTMPQANEDELPF